MEREKISQLWIPWPFKKLLKLMITGITPILPVFKAIFIPLDSGHPNWNTKNVLNHLK